MRYLSVVVLAVVASASHFNVLNAQTPPPSGYAITLINPAGPEYISSIQILAMNSQGRGAGTASRLGSGALNLGADVFFFGPGMASQIVNLMGADYERLISGQISRTGRFVEQNDLGQIAGYSSRLTPSGTSLGRDAWIFTPGGATQIVGLINDDYGGSNARYSELIDLNNSGQAVGISLRGGGTSPGSNASAPIDAWLFNGTETLMINPVGSVYENNSPSGLFRTGAPIGMNDAGEVMGRSRRYGTQNENLGDDAWLFKGAGPATIISMAGPGYEGMLANGQIARESYPELINQAGMIVGGTIPYNSNGTPRGGHDIWLYDGIVPTRIVSLTGAPYETDGAGGLTRDAAVAALTPGGQVVGTNRRYQSGDIGQDAWHFSGAGPAKVISLTGPNYEYTTSNAPGRFGAPEFVNAAGQVMGYNNRYTPANRRIGQDAWFFDGIGTTRVANLTGGDYERPNNGGIERDGRATALNAVGQGVGTNVLYGGIVGRDSWFFDGIATRLISLTGPRFEYVTNGKPTRFSSPIALNDSGQALGYSLEYDPSGNAVGRAGWFYDDSTGLTTPLEFSFRADGSSATYPSLLTDTGVVLGDFFLFDGGAISVRAFWWSSEAGFQDLGELVNGGLSAAGWQRLDGVFGPDIPGAVGTIPSGAPSNIVGRGSTTGQAQGTTAYFVLSQLPEPGCVPILAVAATLLLRTKRSDVRA